MDVCGTNEGLVVLITVPAWGVIEGQHIIIDQHLWKEALLQVFHKSSPRKICKVSINWYPGACLESCTYTLMRHLQTQIKELNS